LKKRVADEVLGDLAADDRLSRRRFGTIGRKD
jgi:hypothetical protein